MKTIKEYFLDKNPKFFNYFENNNKCIAIKLSKPLIITLLPKTYLSKKIIKNANIFPQNEATLLGNISDGNAKTKTATSVI